jgi:hypothetical protein
LFLSENAFLKEQKHFQNYTLKVTFKVDLVYFLFVRNLCGVGRKGQNGPDEEVET